MKYLFTVAGALWLGNLLAQTNDFRILIPYVLGGMGAFLFGAGVKK